MRHFPVFLDLVRRPVLVVGGGRVASRKVSLLLSAGARVEVVAPNATAALIRLAAHGRIKRHAGEFAAAHVAGKRLVIAASDDPGLNARVAREAERIGVPVNVVDDLERSSAILPAIIDRSPVLVAISSGGAAPVLARLWRERLEAVLEPSVAALARLSGRWRARVKTALVPSQRRHFWSEVLRGPVARLIAANRGAEAERELGAALAAAPRAPHGKQGHVALVGAGPGAPELLTLRALTLVQEADVILHDRLVTPAILALARREAELIDVGKIPGEHRASQERINALLIEHAQAGRRVVRLKGGDPLVFARGGEELEALAAHAISYEVVPGITAGLACAAYAGIPLTHRDHASSVRFITAHARDSLDAIDWRALAAERQTLAIYMGVAQLERLRDALLAHGRAASTPFALVENGARPEQRVVLGALAELPELARAHRVQAPALLILGEVAALANRLAWFGPEPLLGMPEARAVA